MPGIFQDWKFKEGHVQSVPEGGDFLSSESCVICAGAPQIPDNIQNVVPIGLVQNATVTQNKQIQQLYEIGSRQPIFIPGRTVVQAALSRILFDGPSLMRAVYKVYNGSNIITDTSVPVDSAVNPENAPGSPYKTDDNEQAKFYINLASEFFNRPLGLAFFLNDMQDQEYGGFYLENCYIQSHQLSIAGQQTILVENCGLRCSRVIPINRSDELTDIDTDVSITT